VFKHTDDDGDLSVFASGDEVLFACSRGHYWVVRAQQTSAKDADERGVHRRPAEVAERFGPAAYRALGLPPDRPT